MSSKKTNSQFLQVSNLDELISTPYQGEMNAICWHRELIGDFAEIVEKIELIGNITEVSQADLLNLQLSEQGELAREIVINDYNSLKAHGASPSLNVIKCYDRDDFFFPTDVYSFHVDRSPIPTHTFLCTYYGEPSEIVANSEAEQKILVPEIRTALKKLYDGDDTGFESFLTEYFFDLHYQVKANAQIINLGRGHMWKLAVDYPESNVLPCIHRAPLEKNGKNRLLIIC